MQCMGKAIHLGNANCGFSCQRGATRAEHCQGHRGAATAIVHPSDLRVGSCTASSSFGSYMCPTRGEV